MGKKLVRSSWLPLAMVAVVLSFALAAFVWLNRPIARPPAAGPLSSHEVLSPAEAASLVTAARSGVGHLENDKFREAEQVFTDLRSRLPAEILPLRDLAICHLLMFERAPADPTSDAPMIDVAGVQKTIDALLQAEPQSAAAQWLAGRFYLKLVDTASDDGKREGLSSQAIAHFERATKLAPENPALWFYLYQSGRFHSDPQRVRAAQAALAEAFRLAPENLYVLTERLTAQAEARDPSIQETITHARGALGPLHSSFERRVRISIPKLLDQAAEAAAKDRWDLVRRNLTPLIAVRNDEVCQGDRRRIEIHPLEYALGELSEDFYQQHSLPPTPEAQAPIRFEVKVVPGELGQSAEVLDARFVDFDLDDQPELMILRPKRLEVYGVDKAGLVGPRIAAVDVSADYARFLIADLDQDTIPAVAPSAVPTDGNAVDPLGSRPPGHCFEADGDVVLFGDAGLLVLGNQLSSDGKTRTLERAAQEESVDMTSPVAGAVLLDMDHDGDLDILASTTAGMRLWSNRGNLLFEDMSSWSILPPTQMQHTSFFVVDWDRDVDVDVLLAGPGGANAGWLESLRHGQFRWRSFDAGFADAASARGVVAMEADGNRSWDLAYADEKGLHLLLSRTQPGKSVTAEKQVSAATRSYADLLAADFDNDGIQDLWAWGASGVALYLGKGAGAFHEQPAYEDAGAKDVTACQAFDADEDGDLDLLVVAGRKVRWISNEGGNRNGYLALRCRGGDDNQSGRVNHWGIGSLLELKAGNMYQARVVAGQRTHFGLGKVAQADVVRILWTQGVPQSIVRPESNQWICEKMILKGSCPFVYTWNGEQFEFFTDLLWAAPLGLQFADGVIAPDRPWEYLRVPGERLRPKKDAYELRITEELWEAAYFDKVQLLAVDHPAEVEVFSNEKVGPAEIAEFKVHTVRNRRPISAARNHRGRDLVSELRKCDGEIAQPFDTTLRQGLAEKHYLELDLGRLPKDPRVMLFLTGWIRPTDTSLNVAISHHPELEAPKPPSVWVPDAEGVWRETIAFMGFPGGKMKTIAVDLSQAFLSEDYRLRIVTSAEIYWDEAFFTLNEQPADVKVTPLKLIAADLHYRGFSAPVPGPRFLPEYFDYASVDKAPHWPPMRGHFTRYGQVDSLLAETDARMVVMGSGDELTVRFAFPDGPLPAGWKRDFILHNVGWDKDADLNTVFGQTVEPLPFVGMPSYPYSDVTWPDDETHRQYLREYQTRPSDMRFWQDFSY